MDRVVYTSATCYGPFVSHNDVENDCIWYLWFPPFIELRVVVYVMCKTLFIAKLIFCIPFCLFFEYTGIKRCWPEERPTAPSRPPSKWTWKDRWYRPRQASSFTFYWPCSFSSPPWPMFWSSWYFTGVQLSAPYPTGMSSEWKWKTNKRESFLFSRIEIINRMADWRLFVVICNSISTGLSCRCCHSTW